MQLENRDKRDSLIYDPQIKGFDSSFWSQLVGTTSVSSGKLRYNAASSASFILFEFGDLFNFMVNVPAQPTSGDSRRWGLFAPATTNIGAIYFDITGAVFTVHVIDSAGNDQSKTLTWNNAAWSGNSIVYGIAWTPDRVQFWINGAIVATFGILSGNVIPFTALPLYIKNGNSDNMDVSYVDVRKAAGIV
jgi:hypothetical protein